MTADPATGRHQIDHDWDVDSSVSTSVVEAVAAATKTMPTEIDPLYDVVDPDALDALVASLRKSGHGTVRFEFAGWIVTLTANGAIDLRVTDRDPLDESL